MPYRLHLDQLFEKSEEGYCLCEIVRDDAGNPADYRFLETNSLFENMTGLTGAVGRSARELVPDLEDVWFETYGKVAAGETMRFENHSPSMSRHFEVFAVPTVPVGRFALIFRDITPRRQAEIDREAARNLAENLLAELNHRVMNTLAMITSIVRMEAQEADEETAPAALQRLESRLAAVTVLYRALNRATDMSQIAAQRYLPEVVNSVAGSISGNKDVRINCKCAVEMLPSEIAAPLGLLLNELMTNALKYAFEDGRSGSLDVELRRIDSEYAVLEVNDDGIGSAGKSGDQRPESSGIGMRLVEAFVTQIDGQLTVDSSDGGTRISIRFPLANAPARA